MRIDWDTPVDVLMHGDNIGYIDLNEDEICHWKYVKREKLPNGKWRYYYDVDQLKDDLGVDERRRYKKVKSEYERSSKRADETFDNWMRYYKSYDYKDAGSRARNTDLRITAKAARDTYNEWTKKYNESWNDYMNTPLGKLAKATEPIERGAKVVSNFFSGIFKKNRG